MYRLSDEDLEIQARARSFADEVIPYEVTAELGGGELPGDLAARHAARARDLGLHAANMPRELGGGGASSLQQVLIQEQAGRVTNALAWACGTPPSWLPDVATPYQLDRYLIPAIRGEAEECYAITEEAAGSDVDAIVATARRDAGDYLLTGEKWHVTSYNSAIPGQARSAGPEGYSGRLASMAAMRAGSSGSVCGRNRPAILPSGATRNFSKFHWMSPAWPSASGTSVSSE